MKQALSLFFLIILLGSCATVNKYSSNLNIPRNQQDLKSDIDFAYRKLQKLHPKLYQYISKEDLDFKFDSLKASIKAPMSANDFYFMLSPVIASIKQGHTRLLPDNKKLKIKDIFTEVENHRSSLYQFEYVLLDDKLYISKNIYGDPGIKTGTELLSVNNIKPSELISKYRPTFSSDGFNQTFIDHKLGSDFPEWFYIKHDIEDSVVCKMKYNDSIQTITLRELEPGERKISSEKKVEMKSARASKYLTKKLSFLDADSSIAIIDIDNFYEDNYFKFYRNTFRLLDTLNTKNLILDLRDNPGGETRDAKDLYSYLMDTSFVFVEKSELTSATSILTANYFKGNPTSVKILLAILSPFELISRGKAASLIEQDPADNKYYLPFPESMSSRCSHYNYKENLYVLIDGGTFSAACILAANLKGSERALFVGEETGGSYNGTVAGKMKTITLPKSKLNLIFGLANFQPHYQTDIEGRGIFPDIEMEPTLEDIINGQDPALNWILDDIKRKQSANSIK